MTASSQAAIAAGAIEDFSFDPTSVDGEGLARHLERRIRDTLDEVLRSRIWRSLADPATDTDTVRDIIREVYLEVVMYQPDAIEAAKASIGQMPRSMQVAWPGEMLHQREKFDHGAVALRDYLGLAGDEAPAHGRMQSPSAFGVAAMWRHITHKRDPFLYLGAVYLLDGLRPIVTDFVMKLLACRAETQHGFEFISHHATADLGHTARSRAFIVEIADRFPEARTSIAYGFEYFRQVYPLPVWEAARMRTLQRIERARFAVAAE